MSFFAPQTYHLPKMRKAYMLKRSKKMMFPNSLHFDIKDKIFGTDDLSPLFSVINTKKEPDYGSDCEMVIPEGVEPSIFWMRTRRPRPLDDGTNTCILTETLLFCKPKKHGIIYITSSGINRDELGVTIKMKIIRRYWRIIFPIFFVILIWHFSAANGENSNNQSSIFSAWLGISNALARKLAHFVLFGALGYSISSFVKGLHSAEFPNFTLLLYPIILCVAYGAIDEVHQLTIMGRNGAISDIFLDFIAGVFGTLVYIAIFCFWRRWRIRRQIKKVSR